MIFHIMPFVAQLKKEDVFKSISENVGSTADPRVYYIVGACILAIIVLISIASAIKKRQLNPRPVNHQGKLLRELLKHIPLKKNELNQLKILASEQDCDSPLTPILCPSLLAKGINARGKGDRKTLLGLARKVGLIGKK